MRGAANRFHFLLSTVLIATPQSLETVHNARALDCDCTARVMCPTSILTNVTDPFSQIRGAAQRRPGARLRVHGDDVDSIHPGRRPRPLRIPYPVQHVRRRRPGQVQTRLSENFRTEQNDHFFKCNIFCILSNMYAVH
jgi:hypothetical protein